MRTKVTEFRQRVDKMKQDYSDEVERTSAFDANKKRFSIEISGPIQFFFIALNSIHFNFFSMN